MNSPARSWYPLAPGQPTPRGRPSRSARAPGPNDPLASSKLALMGRVVTMDDDFGVRNNAVVDIERGAIVAISERAAPAPPGAQTLPAPGTVSQPR